MNTWSLAQRPKESPTAIQSDSVSSHGPDFEIDLQEHLQSLWRQKKIIFSIVAVIMALAFVVLSSLTPRYTASSLVEINPRQSQLVDFSSVLSGLPADDVTIQTEIKIIQSRKIARRTIEQLDLNRNPEFNPLLRADGLVESWRKSLAAWLTDVATEPQADQGDDPATKSDEPDGMFDRFVLYLAGVVSPKKQDSDADDDRVTQELEQVVDTFLKRLTADAERRSRVVRISFESSNPKTAAAVANAVADFYIVAQLEAKFEATKRAMTWLNDRVEQLREEVVVKERAIEEYRARSGLLQGGRDATLTSEQVSELNTQHVLELARLAEARARLRQANSLLESPGGIETSVDVLQSQLIRDLRKSESELERQIAELSEEYGDRHPTLINARAELRDLRSKIQLEVDRIIQGLRNEVAIAQARASSLSNSLEGVKSEVAQLNQAEVDLRALERDASAARTLLETLLQRTKETASQETFQQADADVVSYAAKPGEPSFPQKGLVLFLTFVGALALAAPFAIVLEKMDLGFRSTEQISRHLKVKALGLLPRVSKLASVGKAPHEYILANPKSAFAEGIRTLYTNILLTDVAKRPKVILITSALPREGKTSVSLSLARLMAMVGHRVIIVDCDLRKPSVHKELGLEPGVGLVDCLTSGTRFEDVIEEDEVSGVHVMRAGTPIRNSPEQLDSVQMQKLLRTLSRKYDLVVLDSAPLLAVSDTLFVSRLADKTVFLVRWAQTGRAAATLALKQILAAQADVAGVMLTMVDIKANARYGYGDSGTYHGDLKRYYTS